MALSSPGLAGSLQASGQAVIPVGGSPPLAVSRAFFTDPWSLRSGPPAPPARSGLSRGCAAGAPARVGPPALPAAGAAAAAAPSGAPPSPPGPPPTRLTLAPRADYRRHTRLDMDYLFALCEELERDPGL